MREHRERLASAKQKARQLVRHQDVVLTERVDQVAFLFTSYHPRPKMAWFPAWARHKFEPACRPSCAKEMYAFHWLLQDYAVEGELAAVLRELHFVSSVWSLVQHKCLHAEVAAVLMVCTAQVRRRHREQGMQLLKLMRKVDLLESRFASAVGQWPQHRGATAELEGQLAALEAEVGPSASGEPLGLCQCVREWCMPADRSSRTTLL